MSYWTAHQSEAFVLTAVIYHSDRFLSLCVSRLDVDHFSDPANKRIYKRVVELHKQGRFVDIVSVSAGEVADEEVRYNDIADLPRKAGFGDFWMERYNEEALETHISEIRDAYYKNRIANSVKDGDMEKIREMVAKAQQTGGSVSLSLEQFLNRAIDGLDQGEVEGADHPYALFNTFLGKIEAGSYVVVAGRPSSGKSVMSQDYILSFLSQGKKVLFVSAEMTEKMLQMRMVASILGKDMAYHKKILKDEQYQELFSEGIGKLFELKGSLDIVFTSKIADIEAKVKEGQYDAIVVDYLQFLEPTTSYKGDYERVSAISSQLVRLARKFALTAIVAAQISRSGDGSQPTLADIKGSGQIEQDADVVITLWTDEKDEEDIYKRRVRVDCLKNRNGATWRNSKAKVYQLLLEKGVYRFRGSK